MPNGVHLDRRHIDDYKALRPSPPRSGTSLKPHQLKNRLINLDCFFDRISEMGLDTSRTTAVGGEEPENYLTSRTAQVRRRSIDRMM